MRPVALVALALVLAPALAGCASPFAKSMTLESLAFDLAPAAGDASTEFRVDASRAADAGFAVSIDWGDGTTSPGPVATHRYGFTNGTVRVAVTAADADGNERTVARDVALGTGLNSLPKVGLVASSAWVEVGEEVGFEVAGATDPDGDRLSYFWSYVFTPRGDGHGHTHPGEAPAKAEEAPLPESGASARHAFDAPGDYVVKVRAADPKGGEAVASVPVKVSAVIPSSSFDESFSGAVLVGSGGAGASGEARDALGGDVPGDASFHAFRLPYPGNATITLAWTDPSGQAFDLDLDLTDYATGAPLAKAETRGPGGGAVETIATALAAGSYGLVVRGVAGANVAYTLTVHADLVVTPETVEGAAGTEP